MVSYPDETPWALTWVDAIGHLYHLNGLRLAFQVGSAGRDAAQDALQQAVNNMAIACGSALTDPELFPPCDKVLQSMSVHWSGLTVFVDCPWVPMDNNTAHAASGMTRIMPTPKLCRVRLARRRSGNAYESA